MAVIEDAVKKADQYFLTLFRTKDFLEGEISFGVNEDHELTALVQIGLV